MTAVEFLENVTSFSDLEDFLNEERDDFLLDNDIRWYEDIGDAIDEDVSDYVSYYNDGWKTLYDYLSGAENMDAGEGWYRRNGSFDYDYLNGNDFEDYKQEVYEKYLNNGWFDEEDEEEEEPEEEESYVDPEDLIPLEQEDITFDELFTSGVETVLKAREERIENEKKKDEEEKARLEYMLFSAQFA